MELTEKSGSPVRLSHFRCSQQHVFSDVVPIDHDARAKNSNLFRFVEAFRRHGHKCSKINPVPIREIPSAKELAELEPSRYGLSSDQTFSNVEGILHGPQPPTALSDIWTYLEKIYCGTMAVDFSTVEVQISCQCRQDSNFYCVKMAHKCQHSIRCSLTL